MIGGDCVEKALSATAETPSLATRSGSRKCRNRRGKRFRHLSIFVFPKERRTLFLLFFAGVYFLEVLNKRPISPTVRRRSNHSVLKFPTAPAQSPENGDAGPHPVLHSLPLPNVRGAYLQFQSFDESYVERLRAGDFRTQENFSAYFSALIKIKLCSRVKSPETLEDIRQETFSRFFTALRNGKILQPERLGSFVNSICNHVALEHFRSNLRDTPLGEDEEKEVSASKSDLLDLLVSKETEKKVREILEELSERDRRLLREVFLEERDKDEVCRDFGVDREYLRVLLHRAKQAFKATYLRRMGDNPPDFVLV
jgi:RNA polymerase sigma-70 factor, ECF subfamily